MSGRHDVGWRDNVRRGDKITFFDVLCLVVVFVISIGVMTMDYNDQMQTKCVEASR